MKKTGFLLVKGQTFPYDVLVCLGATREQILEYFNKRFEDVISETEKNQLIMSGYGRTLHLENRAFILWTKDFPKTPEQFGYLAHEIFHVADLMLRSAGLSLSDDSDEAWAYQIDWLTKRIYTEFKL